MEQNQKRALLRKYKDVDLEIIEDDSPPPAPVGSNVLIRIEATSVQSTDLLQRDGHYPNTYMKDKAPMVMGYDFVGKIVAMGDNVDSSLGLKIGDRVGDMPMSRGHARYIERPADKLIKIPDGVEPAAATTLILSWMTAYQMLYRTKAKKTIEAGGTVFVAGGAGAVARAVIVLARMHNCTVYTTASVGSHEFLQELGAKPYDYKDKNWVNLMLKDIGPKGVDVAFDGVLSDYLASTNKVMRGSGHLILYGLQKLVKEGKGVDGFGILRFAPNILFALKWGSSFTFYDISAVRAKHPEYFKEDLAKLLNMLKEGKIDPRVGDIIDLEQINEYHNKLRQGGIISKIICSPS